MEKAGDLLHLFLDKQSIKTAKSYSSFFRSWESIAGADAAAHSRIMDIRKGTLLVEVDHPAWTQMIQMKHKEILNKVQQSFPELGIRKLHLKLGDSLKSAERPRPAGKPEKTDANEPESRLKEAAGENRLQEVLERLKKCIDEKDNSG